MQTAKNILVATDFSILGGGVVRHALELAEMFDARLNVVTVYAWVGAVPPVNKVIGELRAQIAELEAHLKPSGRLDRAVLECGDPAETIVRVAKELHVDMIVMGTNSRRGFNRWASGSVAFDVLRHAPVPVLVVKKASLHAHATTEGATTH